MEADELVREFGAAVDAGHAALLVGAGLSRDAGYPLWGDLVGHAAAQVDVPRMSDFPLWAQYIEQAGGGAEILLNEIVSQIASVKPIPLENHRLMAKLPIRSIWTTNYDAMIETAVADADVVEHDEDLAVRRVGERRIFKMHGSIPFGSEGPIGGRQQLVITRDDYERYADSTHPRLWRLLQAQFLTSSFLFLGFSFDDPNFNEVRKMVRHAIGGGPLVPHYALIKRRGDDTGLFDLMARDLEQQGVHVVEIAEYGEITTVLRRLVARTLPMRLLVSGSARAPEHEPWTEGPYPTEVAPQSLNDLACSLGRAFAAANVPGLLAAGEVGAHVGYAYLKALETYDPARFVLLRRRSDDEDLKSPNKRLGEIRLADTEPSQLRDRAFSSVRCIVVLGGGQGTLDEVYRARAAGMGVIPLAISGGAAKQIWTVMRDDLPSHQIGQRSIPADLFDRLADGEGAVSAAVDLVKQGLFLV